VIAETNTIASMIGLVLRMDTATIVSEHAVYNNDGIRTIALESPTPMRTPGLLWRKDDQRPVAVMNLRFHCSASRYESRDETWKGNRKSKLSVVS